MAPAFRTTEPWHAALFHFEHPIVYAMLVDHRARALSSVRSELASRVVRLREEHESIELQLQQRTTTRSTLNLDSQKQNSNLGSKQRMKHQAWLYKRTSKKRDLVQIESLMDLANDLHTLSNELNPKILIRAIWWHRSQRITGEKSGDVACNNTSNTERDRLWNELCTVCLKHRRLSQSVRERLDRTEGNVETGSSSSFSSSVSSFLGEAKGREEASFVSALQRLCGEFCVCDSCQGLFHVEYKKALFVEDSERHERLLYGVDAALHTKNPLLTNTNVLCIYCWYLRTREQNQKQKQKQVRNRNPQPIIFSTRNLDGAGTSGTLPEVTSSERTETDRKPSVPVTTPIPPASTATPSSINSDHARKGEPQSTKPSHGIKPQTKKHSSVFNRARFQATRKQVLRDRMPDKHEYNHQSQPEANEAEASLVGSAEEWSVQSSLSTNLRFEMRESPRSRKLTRRGGNSGAGSPPTHPKFEDREKDKVCLSTSAPNPSGTSTTAARINRIASIKSRMTSCAVLDMDETSRKYNDDSWSRYGSLDSSICSNSITESYFLDGNQSHATSTVSTWESSVHSTAESLWSLSSIGSTTSVDRSVVSTTSERSIKSAMRQKSLLDSIASCSPTKVQDFPCVLPTMGRNKSTKHVRFQMPLVYEEGCPSKPTKHDDRNASVDLEADQLYFCNCDRLWHAF